MNNLETLALLLLEELTGRFRMEADADGNMFPVWPSPAEIVEAVSARLDPPASEPMTFTPAQDVQFSKPEMKGSVDAV